MTTDPPSIFRRLFDRVFPKTPDFFGLLSEQCVQVGHTVRLLVDFMETGDPEIGKLIKLDEHEADKVKARNTHILNEAFSTPIDREDIYRAITGLDEIVNYCKSTVSEMDALGLAPDQRCLDMALRLREGAEALIAGFGRLATQPAAAAEDADRARKSERRVEKIYRLALAELFQGEDYISMFKRREIYRHLANAADRLAYCANTLHDIVVKMC
ncbi:MAG: DUF47 family protein [Phaeospirillum sp.]|nr:DUF47 family protein [Phaeospirillum sp.]